MGWTIEQQNRLKKEWEIIVQYFPNFEIKDYGSQLCIEGWMYTNQKNGYKLRLYVPSDLPYSVPDVVIIYPYPIADYFGKSLSDYTASATMHILSPRDGYPKICTYKDTHWNPNRTFYNVLIKARIWLEALDGHKRSGQQMDYYLKHQG